MDIALQAKPLKAGLYIVATPIGNLKDISLNALETLMSVDIILCEDTRVSKKLLNAYGISKPLQALHDHNEEQKSAYILEKITAGQSLALISDAGTPLISDPGYKLVQKLSEHSVYITHIPGASSLNTALVLSALPTDRFIFLGFVPAKSHSKKQFLQEVNQLDCTSIMLESPHRILDTLNEMRQIFDDTRQISLCRELTKRYEEVLRMNTAALYDYGNAQNGFKGEITLVVAPKGVGDEEIDVDSLLKEALANYRIKDATHIVAEATGLPKKQLYQRAIELKESLGSNKN